MVDIRSNGSIAEEVKLGMPDRFVVFCNAVIEKYGRSFEATQVWERMSVGQCKDFMVMPRKLPASETVEGKKWNGLLREIYKIIKEVLEISPKRFRVEPPKKVVLTQKVEPSRKRENSFAEELVRIMNMDPKDNRPATPSDMRH